MFVQVLAVLTRALSVLKRGNRAEKGQEAVTILTDVASQKGVGGGFCVFGRLHSC